MHRAPALSYPLGRSRFQGTLVASTCLAGALVGGLWWLASDALNWRHALFGFIWIMALVLAASSWWHAPAGTLRWDGQDWHWMGRTEFVTGRVGVHLDLQFCLVLSLQPPSGRCLWLFPQRRSDAPQWNALRRALFARPAVSPGLIADGDAQGAAR